MSIEELKELCALTVELTKLRQAECKHLCIENFAPELLGNLIRECMGATMVNDDGGASSSNDVLGVSAW